MGADRIGMHIDRTKEIMWAEAGKHRNVIIPEPLHGAQLQIDKNQQSNKKESSFCTTVKDAVVGGSAALIF